MSLANPAAFFDLLRAGLLGPALSPGEVDGCDAILTAVEGLPIAWTAYALATAFHETASTMQPVTERGGPAYFARLYDIAGLRPKLAIANGNTTPGDGAKYAGRGYVQLTWRNNYAKAGKECGVDLVTHPELALSPEIAAKILREGMKRGWFTGKGFADYLPTATEALLPDFVRARRIINGTDKAEQIAGYAMEFQRALSAGRWA